MQKMLLLQNFQGSFCLVFFMTFIWRQQHAQVVAMENNAEAATTKAKAEAPKPAASNSQQQQQQTHENRKPNIVIILIDDMGFNDLSFHGSNQIITPNIDALAYNGIILNRHYVPNLCTPSRATLLTGKYPIHTGTQHSVILNDEPWGLPLSERLMPELFQDAGYATNLIGKWHLGFWRKDLTPTMRGFDHHFGYYSGYIDYYDHTLHMLDRNYTAGLDFRRDLKASPEFNGTYATDIFTREAVRIINEHDTRKPLFLLMSHLAVHTGNEDNPMQAPEEEVEKFLHISDTKRRKYAGMVSRLDWSVGRTMRALADKDMLNNTIVLLYSDNGAPTVGIHSNGGSNYPYRGQKESPWEGGIRSTGAIWSPLLNHTSYVSNQVIHAIDWLPTLTSAAGISLPKDLKLDGVDVWQTLSENSVPQPRRLLHVLDDINGYSAMMRHELKYINGTSFGGRYDGWPSDDIAHNEEDPLSLYYMQEVLTSEVHNVIGDQSLSIAHIEKLRAQSTFRCPLDERNANAQEYICEPLKAPCLFDISQDPCERYNLAKLHPLQVKLMAQEIDQFRLSAVTSAKVSKPDERCDPAKHEGTWNWWNETATSGAAYRREYFNSCISSTAAVVFLLKLYL